MFGGTGRGFMVFKLWNRCKRRSDSKLGSSARQGSLERRLSGSGPSSWRGAQLGALLRL